MSFIMEGVSVTHYLIFPMMPSDSPAQMHVYHTGKVGHCQWIRKNIC